MATVKYVKNTWGVKEILDWDSLAAVVKDAADTIADRAKQSAPVRSGGYRDSITVEQSKPHDRRVARVIADVPYALTVEKSHHVLRRALG